MADGHILFAGAEAALQDALMAALRADPGVRSVFGDPARVYDDETRGPSHPFANLERHESRPINASETMSTEHILTLSTTSRHGGRREAKEALGALRAALETASLQPAGQNVVLAHATYGDVFRTSDIRAFRGVLRVRIITEGVS